MAPRMVQTGALDSLNAAVVTTAGAWAAASSPPLLRWVSMRKWITSGSEGGGPCPLRGARLVQLPGKGPGGQCEVS